MNGELSKDFTMQNVAYFQKADDLKQIMFKFGDLDLKRSSYNQVGTNIISQRVDRKIKTNWDLDFNIKDYVFINGEKYLITNMPPAQRFNVLYQYEAIQILELLKLAN
jgi:hypothetical protein